MEIEQRRYDRPPRRLGRWAAAVPAIIGLAFLGTAFHSPLASAADHHVDCQALAAGDGSQASPFNSLAGAASVTLGPGDGLLLKRGSSCSGQLTPQGGGSASSPATVGAYGTGPLPEVVATGTNAVLLADTSNLVVQDLDISNPGAGEPLGESTTLRNGLMATAQSGPVGNLTLRRLNIHDVAGDLTKLPSGSAAIQVSATGPPPARFENLLIEDNTITRVSRSGISMTGTNAANRPSASVPWAEASHGVVIRRNRIDLMAGDGIVPRGTDGALVESNVVSRGNLAGKFSTTNPVCNAGIWAFRANNTLIQRNEVFGMQYNGCDGTGFDIDYFQDGTIVQFNYSHDNTGGFVLLCSDEEIRSGDVRFNLSVNDSATVSHGPCGFGQGIIGTLSGLRFFNNTVIAPRPSTILLGNPAETMLFPGNFEFRNNLLYALDSTAPAMACGDDCSNNLFFGMPSSGSAAVAADPLLINPLAIGNGFGVAGNFRLGKGSPARGAGTALANPGPGDFFGGPIDPAIPPSIGFEQPAPEVEVVPPPVPPPEVEDRTACNRATTRLRKAKRNLRTAKRKLAKLRRRGAARPRIRHTKRRVVKLKRQVAKRKRAKRTACAG